jgi:acetyl esterase/lipase
MKRDILLIPPNMPEPAAGTGAMLSAWRQRLLWMIFLAGVLILGGCSPQRGYLAALVLADVAAGDGPSKLKQTTAAPERGRISFSVDGRRYRADLYRPEKEALAGLLLIPGAAEAGIDDPRLVALATTLARVRFAVLVPELTGLKELRVGPVNIGEVGDLFAWLASRPELAPQGRAGMAAFSYGAGPALLAALEPALQEKVQFILAVGGYHDLVGVLTFFTTGYFQKDDQWRTLEPNVYGKWVFVRSNAERLADPADRHLLNLIAERRMADPEAPLADLVARLGPEGKAVHAFVTNRDPSRVRSLLKELPAGIREDIAALDLASRDLSRLRARLLLVHGYDDNIIPHTQSIALARAVPRDQARLFLVKGLVHVDIKPGLLSRWRMWRAIDTLLAERSAKGILVQD